MGCLELFIFENGQPMTTPPPKVYFWAFRLAVWCAVCCLCLFNRLRLNFPFYQIFPSRWLQSCLGVCLVPPGLGLPSPAPPHICQREGRFHLLSTQSRFCQHQNLQSGIHREKPWGRRKGGTWQSSLAPPSHINPSLGMCSGLSLFWLFVCAFHFYPSLYVCLSLYLLDCLHVFVFPLWGCVLGLSLFVCLCFFFVYASLYVCLSL